MRAVPRTVETFKAPKRTLGDLDADAAAKIISAASDVAVVIDAKGIVRDVAFGNEELAREGYQQWVGQRFVDTVTVESKSKIDELLKDASAGTPMRWRQVNHPSSNGGADVPIRYSAMGLGSSGRVVAVGRDLRSMVALQQRLVDSQQSMEREYARLRNAETRYRLLFQIAAEAVLVVDATSGRIVDVNPAASELIGRPVKQLSGRQFSDLFTTLGQRSILAHLSAVKAAGRGDSVRARLDGAKNDLVVTASLFRQEAGAQLLIRLHTTNDGANAWLKSRSSLFDVVQKLPDGFLVADLNRNVLAANLAFLDLAQVATEEQVKGQPLDRWLGRHSVDVDVLTKNLIDRSEIRNFATVVRGELGTTEEVEVSGVAVTGGEQPCMGFAIRSIGRRPETVVNGKRALTRSVDQLTELVGRVSLKDLVRESTDLIEKLCIEAALELTHDNRASAAEMLGLSRQGLYSKLRRHGLGDLQSGADD